jgi:probable rRNA maturation factor
MVKPWVRFSYADRRFSLSGKRVLQSFLIDVIKAECGIPCRLQYIFCSDDYLHGINISFLEHDDYTDIITFDLSDDNASLIEGEIYISVDRVEANSQEFAVSFKQEMLRVIFHGALHLCGYGDKSEVERVQMRAKENEYLFKYGVL